MESCKENCMLVARVERLEEDLQKEKETRHETHKEFYNRIRELEKVQSVNQEKLDNIEGKIDGMDGKLDTLLEKPGKRWESVVAAVIAALAGGIVTFILVNVGLG